MDVVLQVVALACGKIERGFLGELIEPGMAVRRQVVVGEVVQVKASNRFAWNGSPQTRKNLDFTAVCDR